MDSLSRPSLASLLDKVRAHYPYGIPASAIVAPALETPPLAEAACALIIIHDGSGLSEEHRTLVDAICEKGMKVPKERRVVRELSRSVATEATIKSVRDELRAPITVILGSETQPGTIETTPDGAVLFGHNLEDIASKPETKRAFWSALQKILS